MNTDIVRTGVVIAAAVLATYFIIKSMQKRGKANKSLQQSHSLLYPTSSIHPQLPLEMQPLNRHGVVYRTMEYPNHLYDMNASSLHSNAHPLSDPQEHPEHSIAAKIRDGNTGQIIGNGNAGVSLQRDPKAAQRQGFSVATWDAGRRGAEIVYLGKGFMFERYPENASRNGVMRMASGAEKIATPYLPFISWDNNPWYAVYSPSGSGTFVVYPATDPSKSKYTRSILYLTPTGDKRLMTSVPTATRFAGPTVQRRRTDDNELVSDFPLIFRVTRHHESTILDTATLYLMDWQRREIAMSITPKRQFQLKHSLTGEPLGAPVDWFPYLAIDGKRKTARVREGNELSFIILDNETSVHSVQDFIYFLGPREEYFSARLIPLRDSIEGGKVHLN